MGSTCLRIAIRFPLNPLEPYLLYPVPPSPSLIPLTMFDFWDTLPCQSPPGPVYISFRIGIRLPLNPFESYLFLPLFMSPPSRPLVLISLTAFLSSNLGVPSPRDDTVDSSDKSGSRDGAAVSDSCRPGVDAVLRAEERVDGASDASLVVSLKGVLEVCEFVPELSVGEDGDEMLEADEGVVENDPELLEDGFFSFSVLFSFPSLSYFFSFSLLEFGLNVSLSDLSFLYFDIVLGFSCLPFLDSFPFLFSATFSVG